MDEVTLTAMEYTMQSMKAHGTPVLFAELPDAVLALVAEYRALRTTATQDAELIAHLQEQLVRTREALDAERAKSAAAEAERDEANLSLVQVRASCVRWSNEVTRLRVERAPWESNPLVWVVEFKRVTK